MEKKQREKKKHKIIIILFTKRFGFFLSWLFSAWVEFSSFAAAVFFLLLLLIFVFLLLARFTPVMVYFRFCCPISNQHHQPVAHFSGSYIMKLNPGAEAREPSAVRYDAMPTADGSFVFFGWVGNRFCFFFGTASNVISKAPLHHGVCMRLLSDYTHDVYIIAAESLQNCAVYVCVTCVCPNCISDRRADQRETPTNQPTSESRAREMVENRKWLNYAIAVYAGNQDGTPLAFAHTIAVSLYVVRLPSPATYLMCVCPIVPESHLRYVVWC